MSDVFRAGADRTTYRFWLLSAFLTLVSLLGGSSRADVPSLLILRPVAACVLVTGLYSLTRAHVSAYRFTFAMMAAALALIVLDLVPLPPGLWHLLPGRELMVDVDRAMGTPEVWRPLSMVPSGTWNALFAMLPPLAVLVLAAQLNPAEHRRLLPLLIGIAALCGLLGLLQVIGPGIGSFYAGAGEGPKMATGMFANPNHHAAYLACAIPMLAVFAGTDVEKAETARVRTIAAVGGIFLLIPLVGITGSRAGVVLAAIALSALPLVWRKPMAAKVARRRAPVRLDPRYVLGAGIAPASLVAAFLFYKANMATRLLGVDPLADYRFMIWRPIVSMVATYMPFGSGIGSFVEVYQIGEPLDLLRAQYVNHAHNDVFELVMTGGVPAVVLLAFALIAWGRRAYTTTVQLVDTGYTPRQAIRLDRLGIIAIGLLGLASLTDYPLRTPSLACLLVLAALWTGTATATARKSRLPDGN